VLQLGIEVTPVAQAGHWILVRMLAQPLAALRLFIEHQFDLARHAIHGLDHATQFPCARQLGLER